MVKKLSERGYVRYTPYRGVDLTTSGTRMALKIVRRHRLWEMFLVKVLGFSWDRIHDEAERLEHATSDELEARLDEAMGYPAFDPHGDPIPSVDGRLDTGSFVPLADCAPGDTVKVRRVSDEDPEVLKYAAKLGMGLRKKIQVKEKMAFDGSLRVDIGGKDRFISVKLARNVFVEHA
jgi:DtxR family Mn-dependent transcriptional regulator